MRFATSAAICILLFSASIYASATIEPERFTIPLRFEQNHGQSDADAKFIGAGKGYRVLLTTKGAKLLIRTSNGKETTIELLPKNANPHSQIIEAGGIASTVNYFSGSDPAKWKTNIPAYRAAINKDVYPGINWKFYERDGLLEYDFIVSAGADASQIQLEIKGGSIEVDRLHNLNISTADGIVKMHAPHVYQCNLDESGLCVDQEKLVASAYRKSSGNIIEFALNSYDAKKQLVIDPKISFGTLMGGNTVDSTRDLTVDNKGNIYVVGYTEANTRLPGYGDAFVHKFSPAGILLWTTFFIGAFGESADSIAVTPAGISYVGGTTNSRDFPIVGGFQNYGGSNDGFIVKLAANGTIMRSSFLGGNSNDIVAGVELGAGPRLTNGLYIYGTTSSRNFPSKSPTQRQFGGGRQDGFITIVNTLNFTTVMSTFVGRSDADEITSFAVNNSRGDLYATVITRDQPNQSFIAHLKRRSTTAMAVQPPVPPSDYFSQYNLATGFFSAIGIFKWMDLTGRLEAGGFRIHIAASSCVPSSPGVLCNDNGGLITLNQDLNRISAMNFGGPSSGLFVVNDIRSARNGKVYLVGETLSSALPKVNAFQPNKKGGVDAFVIAISPASQQVSLSSYLGGTSNDYAGAVAVDNAGNIIVGGTTFSKQFPTTPGAQKRTTTGTTDGYVVKITP